MVKRELVNQVCLAIRNASLKLREEKQVALVRTMRCVLCVGSLFACRRSLAAITAWFHRTAHTSSSLTLLSSLGPSGTVHARAFLSLMPAILMSSVQPWPLQC